MQTIPEHSVWGRDEHGILCQTKGVPYLDTDELKYKLTTLWGCGIRTPYYHADSLYKVHFGCPEWV